ncbi:MAG: CPBP family intramembrane metalloprotease [Ferruginibacter sp.]|nr:CPBP family intramembrane metalloprotease [Ferruginibacter sp.]
MATMLGCLIYLNYWQHVEKKYVAAATTKLGRFIGYYLLYLIPFAGAFFLQLLFYKDCSYYKNGWFWAILVLAPAFFAFRINFNWQQGWIKDHYTGVAQAFYLQSINWIVRVFILLIPVFIIWVLKDKGTQPFYGSVPLASVTPYLWMLLIMLPLIALASTQADFLKVYPKAAFINKIPTHSWQDGWRYMAYELCYGFDFISIEFFFRGFLILSLVRICGMHCIVPAACFYCAIHLGKPMGEAISSFFGGTFLGIVVYNTGSIWGGLIVHLGIAWMMEIGGWLGAVFIPTVHTIP